MEIVEQQPEGEVRQRVADLVDEDEEEDEDGTSPFEELGEGAPERRDRAP